MKKGAVRVVVDRMPQVLKGIKQMAMERVLVGVPGETADRQPESGEHGPMNNPTLLYIHENGSPAANIPARPTLMPGINDVRDKVSARLAKVGQAVLDGRDPDIDQQLTATGLIAQAAVRARFGGDDLAPLSPSTLSSRKAAGFRGEAPLIRTGQLRTAVTFVVARADGRREVGDA